jgi:hypothetical protein
MKEKSKQRNGFFVQPYYIFFFFFFCLWKIRLHVKGLKTLKDRTRLQQIDFRLNDVNKDISSLRMRLSAKPA